MLNVFYPRRRARVLALPLLGPHAEDFAVWLHESGYPPLPIRLRLAQLRRVDELLQERGFACLRDLSAADLLALAPRDSQDDVYLAAVVRSLARYFSSRGWLAVPAATPAGALVAEYHGYLDHVRGFAASTCTHHASTAAELLSFLDFDAVPARLRSLGAPDIEAFLRIVGPRLSRDTLQHTVSHLRSFLRYLAAQSRIMSGLDAMVDSPRLYRGERLPRSLSWEIVGAFLAAIDRSTPMGKRDYAMFLLMATYGLRTCEVAALRLDDIQWRTSRLQVPRSKVGTPLVLPLIDEVGAAVADYLQHGRPTLPHREVFLRARAPAGTLRPTAITEAFQGWVRRSGLPITYQGPHCLRHSLAVHLLRQGAPLKTIGELLGHRTAESTCVYLRLHVEDLRDVALDLPILESQR